ncbi:hypothetical protein MN116_007902 [Schistosoma mekongi]|uniref:G-protein coupled receptors family 1 profile domain-containing protein n=1 Tax=Schistosoma mekongi TaxID=38744 RepID=A0AAE1Z705_SCHME|nr:hypothetical protein MN116_007902 [Schistosoma mekongi]
MLTLDRLIEMFKEDNIISNLQAFELLQRELSTTVFSLAKRYLKLIKMLITVAFLYAASQLPRHLIYLITMNKPDAFQKDTIIYIWLLCQLSAWSATCYNPIVYIWMRRTFRRGVIDIFHSICFCLHVHNSVQYTTNHSNKQYSKHQINKHNQHFQSNYQKSYTTATNCNCMSSNNEDMKSNYNVKYADEHITDTEYSSINTQYTNMKTMDKTTTTLNE